jgi:hypothetical protein
MTTGTRVLAIGLTALTLTAAARGQPAPDRKPLPAGPPAAAPAPAPTPAPAADPTAQLTETVGLLSGLYLYQTYLTIGLLADGRAEEVYDERAARAVLDSVLNPLEAVDRKLEGLAGLVQSPPDRDAVARLRWAVYLLRRQGAELTTFWATGRPEDGARYEATRQEAWKWVTALVGLEKK